MRPDWTCLPENTVNMIAEKASGTNLQYANFRTVCKDWWRAVPPYPKHLRRGLWLMLPKEPSDSNFSFYDVLTSQTHRFQLPYMCGKNICGSSHGWLVLEYDNGRRLSLFNPITQSSLDLPYIHPIICKDATSKRKSISGCSEQQHEQYTLCVRKVILSCSPTERGCIVIAYFLVPGLSNWELGFCKIGDTRWTWLKRMDLDEKVLDFTYHNNRVYMISSIEVSVYDLRDLSVKKFSSKLSCNRSYDRIGLVEGGAESGEPLVVVKDAGRREGNTTGIIVYKWSDDRREWSQVRDIGKRAIVLNSWVCLSVSTINLLSEKELQENETERLENELYYVTMKHVNDVINYDFSVRLGITRVNLERETDVNYDLSAMESFSSISGIDIWLTPSLT